MIAYLKGRPLVQGSTLILLVNDVGYGLHVTSKTLTKASRTDSLELFVYTHVKEEALDLYGFLEVAEKDLFVLLLGVSGVGPKTALALVEIGTALIIDAVQTANVSLFTAAPRVGKKLAQKIIIDLKSKLGSLHELQLGPRGNTEQDVIDSLTVLGFAEMEIERILPQLTYTEGDDVSQIVKQALKLIHTR